MSDWTSGYVAEVGYTYGSYAELSAQRVRMAFLSAGLVPPAFGTACELGFGQGLSANLNAAATVTRWHGNDFLPAQAAYAQDLAAASGSGGAFTDQAFAEYCAREDLPDFDFIGLHGTWSWINDENRRVIVDFVRRKLKVGGVLYVSYNTQPGWATMIPMRHLLTEHARIMGSTGQGMPARIGGALEFGEKLLELNPAFSLANPEVKGRFARLKTKDRAYLAHEFFNRDWHPMPFAEMAGWLADAKVDFACSAHLLDHVDEVHLTPAQQQFLLRIPHAQLRQTTRDYFVDMQFRRDYWVKGLRRIGLLEQMESWRAVRVLLVTPRADVALKVRGNLGEVDLQAAMYTPLLDALDGHRVRSVAELEQALAPGLSLPQVLQAVRMLYAKGDLALAQDDAAQQEALESSGRINRHLMHRSRGAEEGLYLASPVTGSGVPVPRFHQLFLLARAEGRSTPGEWAAFVQELLLANREKIVKDGKPLTTPQELLAELTREAESFEAKHLPIYRALRLG